MTILLPLGNILSLISRIVLLNSRSCLLLSNPNTRRFRVAIDTLFSLASLRTVYASAFLDFLPPRMGPVMRGRMARCFARHRRGEVRRIRRDQAVGLLSRQPAVTLDFTGQQANLRNAIEPLPLIAGHP